MAPKTDNQVLPNKEAALFRQLVKQYESKMFRKGIKTADSILKKFPDNGETLAMKGLLLNCLERKEEAYDHVKRGVKANLRSHVCWHVYGLLYKSDREFEEAIKCYKNSLRMDKDNLTVLRDLTQLQIQLRDYSGFLESRQRLLELKPNNRQSWIGLALAHHLKGNHKVAATVIESYESTVEDIGSSVTEQYEHSEILLYKSMIWEEGGNPSEALAALEKAEKQGLIRDNLSAMETRARLLLALERFSEAQSVYRQLLDINPENYPYIDGLLTALGIARDDVTKIIEILNELQIQYPHSTAAKRRPLDILPGGSVEFEAAADSFVRRYLSKGIPSLFSALLPLYGDATKSDSLGRVLQRIENALEASGDFPPPLSLPMQQSVSHHAGPHALTWTRLYLSMHYSEVGDTEKALHSIDDVIKSNPAMIEPHSAKSKILDRAGDTQGAAFEADTARRMDLADRYLNIEATKALFKAGRTQQAEATVTLFTKEGDQANNLFDMQATWYEIASGNAYLANREYGKALKRFLKVDSHFLDFVEDQFDFHQYCLRKQTMRAYVDMLRMEDNLYKQDVYAEAAQGAVTAYLALFDDPQASPEEQEAQKIAAMDSQEAKKYLQKKRKEEAKKNTAAKSSSESNANQPKDHQQQQAKVDPDPDGFELASTKDPLGEATKLIRRLENAASDKLETHLLAFEVYIRKKKLLMATKTLNKARALGGDDARVHAAIVRLAVAIVTDDGGDDEGHSSSSLIRSILKANIAELINAPPSVLDDGEKECGALAKAVAEYHGQWVAQHGGTSIGHAMAAARASMALSLMDRNHKNSNNDNVNNSIATEFGKHAAMALSSQPPNTATTHEECVAAHRWLKHQLKNDIAANDFAKQCSKVFRWSRYFEGDRCAACEVAEEMDGDTAWILSSDLKKGFDALHV